MTNNEAKYEALIGGKLMAKQVGSERLRIKLNPWLVVRQVMNEGLEQST